jgi:hypothetical protein
VTQDTSTPTRRAIFIDFIEEFGELVPALRMVAGEGAATTSIKTAKYNEFNNLIATGVRI